ncbi:DUF4350 domain-containing protein [Brevundimonas sp. SL130]|uniref:DUF4350 domain-containing protein n=1 Tax=Brevundimonas sp. SL130 TaxID=2995143 RepID=UPI00226CA8EA|nr:DUF4350 domain-containing protein [Brevundimonas sp. SL130]WAC60714.1 DUF4350 domain-containing protein [Brevundimonas sp. SL130]
MTRWGSVLRGLGLLAVLAAWPVAAQEQQGDLDWRPQVASPAYATDGPLIRVDEGHGGVQTIDGRYAGFAALMRADGYRVDAWRGRLDAPGALDGIAVLVISNAASPADGSRISAFDEAEIEAVAHWVERGGALLLAADHAPHGTAAEALGARFGVTMGKGYAFQPSRGDVTANLVFPRQALGDHPIIAGRNESEDIQVVETFTGQSIAGPEGGAVLLAMSDNVLEAPDLAALQTIRRRLRAGEKTDLVMAELARPALSAQGVAFPFGGGRVVVLGEAGMLTAQIVRFPDQPEREPYRFGLNTEGHDDQQFALNLMHWLSRILP